jgi:hypothetical protein
MPLAGFEPTIPELKRAKTFHALDGNAHITFIYSQEEAPVLLPGRAFLLPHNHNMLHST